MSGGGGNSAPSSQTVTQTQQIPQFEQQFAQQNQDLARSLGSQPFPQYGGPLVQGFAPAQTVGQGMAIDASTAYQPSLAAASNLLSATTGAVPGMLSGAAGAAGNMTDTALNNAGGLTGNALNTAGGIDMAALMANPANAGVMQALMSPYVGQALAPQINALQTQLGQEQNQINAQATGANAFGDARQGAENALQNFYGNEALTGLVGQGYNTAYSNALQTALGEQSLGAQIGQGLGQLGEQGAANLGGLGLQGANLLGNLGLNSAQILGQTGLQGAQDYGNLGQLAQALGLQGANSVFDVGQQQQQLGQQELNTAYTQFLNQVQWPYQMLNVQESALSNSPYNLTNTVSYPGANQTAQNLGLFSALAGLLGGGGSVAPFGGSPYNAGRAQA